MEGCQAARARRSLSESGTWNDCAPNVANYRQNGAEFLGRVLSGLRGKSVSRVLQEQAVAEFAEAPVTLEGPW